MKKVAIGAFAAAIATALLADGSAALAQASVPAPTREEVGQAGLEEIVVTAQRRAQNQQEVPIAVTTFTAKALEFAGVGSTDQLLAVTPGVTIQRQLAGATPFIRGIGTQTVAPGIESAVATYVDGVYYVSPYANIFSFSNVQQVEVLRGPQGTLFGRNATGGLLAITMREPQAEAMFKGSLSYGNFGTVDASAYVTAGNDDIAFDLAGQLTRQERGYGRNLLTGADVNYRREKGVRSKILWSPGDFKITLSGDYSKLASDLGFILQPVPGSLSAIGTPAAGTRYDSQANFPQFNDVEYYGGSVKLEYDLGPVTLSSLTAYRHLDVLLHFDQDSTPAPIVNVVINQRDHSFQQEFLVQGKTGRLNYTLGLFYFDAAAGYLPLNIRSSIVPSLNFDLYTDLTTKSYAAFAQGDYELGDDTTITAGVRYTVDERGYTGALVIPGGDRNVAANVLNAAVGSKKFPKLTWRLAVNHKLDQDVNLYGSYSRGFKGGAFGTGSVSNVPIKPETIDAWEAGLKSELLDRNLRINLSGFYYDYKNIQLNQIRFGGSVLLNAAKGRLYGGEVETSYAIPVGAAQLTLNAALSYLNAKYTSFPNGPTFTPTGVGGNVAGSADLSGKRMIHAPETTVSVGGNFTTPIDDETELQLSANYFHSSSFFWEPENRVRQPAYDLLSAQAAISFEDGRYRLRVFGKI
jgi:iron complex outermembrane receptor protein